MVHEIRKETVPSEREKKRIMPKLWEILVNTVVLARTCQELVHICY